jgi:hypothetical protein
MGTENRGTNAQRVAQQLLVSVVVGEYLPRTICFMLWQDKLLGTPSFTLHFLA